MPYSDRYGDRDRERDWIRGERERARDAYDRDYGEDRSRLERSYADRDYQRDNDRDPRAGRERDTRGYIPFGATGPTYYGGGFSGEPGRYPGDVGRQYADEGSDRYRGHEIPSGHYFGDTSAHRGRADYVPNPREGRGEEGRSWLNKAADEARAFFGDDDAKRRREWDEMRQGGADRSERYATGEHRGRGPKGYRRSDERIREDVSDRLTEDQWLDATYIEVEAKDGEVTLSGLVARREDKRRAEDLADSCSGVTHVQNNLRVQTADRIYGDADRSTLETGGMAATQATTTTSKTGEA